jgi:nitronate monooxygenase
LPPFEQQIEAVLRSNVPVFSFTFGIPAPEIMRHMKDRGIRLIGTATTVAEARALEQAGVDAIAAQGSEAGAHRGTFIAAPEDSLVGTIALVPQIVDAVSVPVIASGGIMDGRGIVAAAALGSSGVQLGTGFLTCPESGAPPAHNRGSRGARRRHDPDARVQRPSRARNHERVCGRDARSRKTNCYPIPRRTT